MLTKVTAHHYDLCAINCSVEKAKTIENDQGLKTRGLAVWSCYIQQCTLRGERLTRCEELGSFNVNFVQLPLKLGGIVAADKALERLNPQLWFHGSNCLRDRILLHLQILQEDTFPRWIEATKIIKKYGEHTKNTPKASPQTPCVNTPIIDWNRSEPFLGKVLRAKWNKVQPEGGTNPMSQLENQNA